MKTIIQIKNALQFESVKYFNGGDDGFAIAIEKNSDRFQIIVSWGKKWDHVSVSLEDRCPTWDELCWIKDLFWNDNETVIQYHPAKGNYINFMEFCLHLWKPQKQTMPLPPTNLI